MRAVADPWIADPIGTALAAIEDRAVGALLGLAIGDAIGATLESALRDCCAPVEGMIGGGLFRLEPGQWTDDTSLALALGESLVERGGLDEADLMQRFGAWWREGRYASTGRSFGIGPTTRASLERWLVTGDPVAGSAAPDTATNGSLMRLAPVAIRYWNDAAKRREAAARQSRTTHGAAEAVDACIAFADLLADAIAGKPRIEVLRARDEPLADTIATIMKGSWRGKQRKEIASSSYVAHTLEAAIWSMATTGDFRSAILLAANLGDDADTTAAVTGQIAGALYGLSGIPGDWKERVFWSERIQILGRQLVAPPLRR
ncbi:MAG: ADP-ribosylglycohydrolase family protein [Methyloceanibacter sp.]